MIDAQLGPPVAVAGRRGSTPSGGAGGENATGFPSSVDDGGFPAALERRSTPPASSDARPTEAQTPRDAAGPQTGELQEEVAAEAGASQDQTDAATLAVATAAVVTIPAPTVAATTPVAGAVAGQQAVEAVQAAGVPQPIAGLVPARLDGAAAVAPAFTTTTLATTTAPVVAPTTAQPQVPGAVATIAQAMTAVAPAPDTATAAAPAAAPAPAATVTLTLTPAPPADTPEGGPAQGMPLPAPAPVAATPVLAADDAPAPVPTVQPQLLQAATQQATTEAPAGAAVSAPPAPPVHSDPLAGVVRPNGGLTTPHELGREIGTRVHMAVREGGRELVVNLRPAELGHLTIRVTMVDGVMQAQITAERPEAARMLQQSLGHLDTALGDLGYSLDNLDIAYGERQPRDAQASQEREAEVVSGEVLEADGTPALTSAQTTPAPGSSGRLDILA